MTFSFNLSDGLKATIRVLQRRYKKTVEILNKKIKQIINCDETAIEHYKNLRYELKAYKRVHISKSFVLFFKVFKKDGHIIFDKLGHHDDVYRK